MHRDLVEGVPDPLVPGSEYNEKKVSRYHRAPGIHRTMRK